MGVTQMVSMNKHLQCTRRNARTTGNIVKINFLKNAQRTTFLGFLRFLTTAGSNSTEVSGSFISDGRIMGIACLDHKLGKWSRIFVKVTTSISFDVLALESDEWNWMGMEWNGIG